MNKKQPINAGTFPKEMTELEGLKSGINIANMSEAVNIFFWKIANDHTLKELHKTLRRFRGKPFGFWRKPIPEHHGKK